MVQRNMNKSELKEKIRRMKMELQELEECLDKYEERDNRYDDDPQYRNRNSYDDEERYQYEIRPVEECNGKSSLTTSSTGRL